MNDIDLTKAIEAATEAMHGDECPEDPHPDESCTCDASHYDRLAGIAIKAALPEIRRQLAKQIEAHDLSYGSTLSWDGQPDVEAEAYSQGIQKAVRIVAGDGA